MIQFNKKKMFRHWMQPHQLYVHARNTPPPRELFIFSKLRTGIHRGWLFILMLMDIRDVDGITCGPLDTWYNISLRLENFRKFFLSSWSYLLFLSCCSHFSFCLTMFLEIWSMMSCQGPDNMKPATNFPPRRFRSVAYRPAWRIFFFVGTYRKEIWGK